MKLRKHIKQALKEAMFENEFASSHDIIIESLLDLNDQEFEAALQYIDNYGNDDGDGLNNSFRDHELLGTNEDQRRIDYDLDMEEERWN